MSNPLGTTVQSPHLDHSAIVAPGKVGSTATVALTAHEVRTQLKATAHLTPEAAREVAAALIEHADAIDCAAVRNG